MPVVMPIQVQVPPSYKVNIDFLQERVNRYAQALVDADISTNLPHRKMTSAEVAAQSIPLEESKRRLTELIHNFYHPEA